MFESTFCVRSLSPHKWLKDLHEMRLKDIVYRASVQKARVSYFAMAKFEGLMFESALTVRSISPTLLRILMKLGSYI